MNKQSYSKPGGSRKNPVDAVELRRPRIEDGAGIWRLVKNTGVLDLNSSYSYLMLCRYFFETCVVAEDNGKVVGFLSAFHPPNRPDVIFVWQIGVDASQRGKGLGISLLKELLERDSCRNVKYMETTISPSNKPSQSLFKRLACDYGAKVSVEESFTPEHFPGGQHEAETMFRIGPLNLSISKC